MAYHLGPSPRFFIFFNISLLLLLTFHILSAPNLWLRCGFMFALIIMPIFVLGAGSEPLSFCRYSTFSGLMVHNNPLLFQFVTRRGTVGVVQPSAAIQ